MFKKELGGFLKIVQIKQNYFKKNQQHLLPHRQLSDGMEDQK